MPNPRPQVFEPQEQRYTTWYNPLQVEQKAVLHENGRPTLYRFPPGGETRVPSIFDSAIQSVICTDRECRDRGGYCQKGHEGRVAAGLAPQLVNKGREAPVHLDPAVDEQKAKRAEAEVALAQAHLAREAAEKAQIVAASRMAETEAQQAKADPKAKKLPQSLA